MKLHRVLIALRAGGLGLAVGIAAALVVAGAWGALLAGLVGSMTAARILQRWQPPEDRVDTMLTMIGDGAQWWSFGSVGGAVVGCFVPGKLGPYGAAAALVAGSVVSVALTVWQARQFGTPKDAP